MLFVLFLAAFAVAERGLTPKLGIDLQGGTRVTLIPIGQPDEQDLRLAQDIIRDRVDGLGVAGTSVVLEGSNIVLTVPGEDSSQARDLGTTSQLTIRPVLQTQPVSEGDLEPVAAAKGDREAVAREVAAAREVRQGDPAELAETLATFRCPERDVLAGFDDQSQALIACGEGAKYVLGPVPLLVGEPEDGERLDGQQIVKDSVSSGFSQQAGQNEVSFRFAAGPGDQGSATWSQLTQEYLQQQIAILLDGSVISAPVVQGVTPVGSATSITGSFTMDEAASLAANLRYGALPISFEDPNVDNVPASLGLASLDAGLLAGAIGFLLVLAYSALYYRLLGVLAFISLALSFLLTYVTLVFLGYTVDYSLDLAGIAGLVIGIGMTADSYVVFFERIKDELRDGHRFRSAVPRAWKSASRTIVTGNVVSLIGAVVLYLLASGEVRGFAFTLGLTTVMDVFVAFTVTWPFVYLASTRSTFAKPWANGMGRMSTLQAAAAEQRRLDQAEERERDQTSGRGVSATINGPGGATATLPRSDRPATDEEEGR
ncbi:preprotein translocase subunit SecD [Dietzia psychralcaliphila]|uniref:Protein translocase subunit SecD n=1 Tax=Dietzia psychralcaliphila TaxID=139021 RepID=A0AAD0JWY5_9ACTN|nr:protein translocase subunit SecD [Dietzia psychralcaliphila]AWH97320.1 preprotein translocase subunit SecD [Dietzia psychralcaliphila]